MPCFDCWPPVLVFLAVAVAEAGVDAQRDAAAGADFAVLIDHVGRAAVDGQVVLGDDLQCVAIEDVGGVDDLRRVALAGLVAGGDRAVDFAGAHGVDHHAVAAHEVEDGDV